MKQGAKGIPFGGWIIFIISFIIFLLFLYPPGFLTSGDTYTLKGDEVQTIEVKKRPFELDGNGDAYYVKPFYEINGKIIPGPEKIWGDGSFHNIGNNIEYLKIRCYYQTVTVTITFTD